MSPRPTETQTRALAQLARHAEAPAPPAPPVEGECCQRACERCVWDYWRNGLDRWAEKHDLGGEVARVLGAAARSA